MDQYRINPSSYGETNCFRGQVKHIEYGRFDFSGSDVQAHGAELRPVVVCAEDSMTLTVRRTRAGQLRVSTGNDSSLDLSKLPPQCGFSIYKSLREVSITVKYNGCLVTVQNSRHWLPLRWRRTPVRMSCPLSPKKSRALADLSSCCSPSDLTVHIQGSSLFKEPSVNVRGEWTPLLELVQHCGYRLNGREAEIVITVPFLACGITSREGHHALFLKIIEDVFMFTCPISSAKKSQSNIVSQSVPTKTDLVPKNLKPNQWAPPFYLAPPLYPHPTRNHRARVLGSMPATPTMATYELPHKTPLQAVRNDHPRPSEENPNMRTSLGDSARFSHQFKDALSVNNHPAPTKTSIPSVQPHYVFHPYYRYYHLPKIPQRDWSLNTASATESYHSTDLRKYSVEHHNRRMTPPSTEGTFAPVTASENRPFLPHMYYPLAYNPYHLNDGPQSESHQFTASTSPPQMTAPIFPSEDAVHMFGSVSQSEDPQPFAPAHDADEANLLNKKDSPSHVDFLMKEWFNQVTSVTYGVVPPILPTSGGSLDSLEANMQDQSGARAAPLAATPRCPGTGSRFHCSVAYSCFALLEKDCILEAYLLFTLPKFVVDPKVLHPDHYEEADEVSCAIGRLTSSPQVFFVPLKGCGIKKQVIDALIVYRLELETRVSDDSLRMMVECSLCPGLLGEQTLSPLEPLPSLSTAAVPVRMRVATDKSVSFLPEPHAALSTIQGRLVFLELSLHPPDLDVVLLVHYCLAYTLTPYSSAMLVYDCCPSGGDLQPPTLIYPNTHYIMVTSFLSPTSPSPLSIHDADPEVYFYCFVEVCSALHGVCAEGCVNCPD
ncbi:unnamed protein product [Knipowitschia caucasica]|uniref:ZP domain-containing protein n=1 Tax=Knipowitschia caucasica TaxID=637954 RepID=A0AAV2KKZ6_KNICA